MWLFTALLLFLTGCSNAQDPITGPKTVSGQEHGSLTVRFRYDPSWKYHNKYWCQGADWDNCEILIKTKEQLVKRNRVTIKDDQTDFIITVTMEDLRISDAGIYWCAIERYGSDFKFKVNVNIGPGMKKFQKILAELRDQGPCPSNEFSPEISTIVITTAQGLTSTVSNRENIGNHGETQPRPLSWYLRSSIYFKLLVFLEVPLFLSMISAVLWVNRPLRCPGGGEVGLVEVQSSGAQQREKHHPTDKK